VARSAAKAVGAETCHIALYDSESDEMIARRARYAAPSRSVPRYRFGLASSPASCRVVRSGEPYLTNDPANDPLYDPSVADKGIHSVLTVPVLRDGKVLGLVYALNKPGGFSDDDARALSALAGAFAVTLQNVRLYTHERERRVLNESLWEMSRALIGSTADTADLGVVLEHMGRVVHYQAASALVREGERLRVAASRDGVPRIELASPSGPLARVLAGGPLESLPSAATLPLELGLPASSGEVLAAPLVAREGVLGALVVAFEPDQPPIPRDRQLVGAFADHAAVFLEAGAVLRREREARERAALLARLTRLGGTPVDAESLLQAAAPEVLSANVGQAVGFYLKHPREPKLLPAAFVAAETGEELSFWQLTPELGAEPIRALGEERRPLLFGGEGRPLPVGLLPFPSARWLALVPLVFRDALLGALAVWRRGQSRGFDPALVVFLRDVAQQVALGVGNARLFATLSQLAGTDDLTQLANRRKFGEMMRLELARARRNSESLALVLADVDHLKRINDCFGHPAGDMAIRHVAEALQRGRRETDLAARLGGEEFALLLPATDREGALRAAERVRRDLAESMVPEIGTVTVSLGGALFPDDGSTGEELLAAADERLYAAKAAGRNRVVV
jgi:diguanylate cyclase (GGDEF)-like protein